MASLGNLAARRLRALKQLEALRQRCAAELNIGFRERRKRRLPDEEHRHVFLLEELAEDFAVLVTHFLPATGAGDTDGTFERTEEAALGLGSPAAADAAAGTEEAPEGEVVAPEKPAVRRKGKRGAAAAEEA